MSLTLAVVSFPHLDQQAVQVIQQHRERYDTAHFQMIAPHITFVFPCFAFTSEEFCNAILNQIASINSFEMEFNTACVVQDSFSANYHLFLIADKGNSTCYRIHDLLYDSILLPERRFDIAYIPHLRMGTYVSSVEAQQAANDWNKHALTINAKIDALTIIQLDQHQVSIIKQLQLH